MLSVLLTVAVVLAAPLAGADGALTGTEIRKLLVGNTATGALPASRGGGAWFAYYRSDGGVDYLVPTIRLTPIARGARWHIAEDAWCIVWPRSGEICYQVVMRTDGYEFISGQHDSPGGLFTVLPGDPMSISGVKATKPL